MRRFLSITAVTLLLLCSDAALAGAPLKGVGVSLGKTPGGSPAARTTDANGVADFGVLPAGSYTLELTAPQNSSYKDPEDMTTRYRPGNNKTTRLHVVVLGVAAGKVERDVELAPSAARVAPISLSLNGKDDVRIVVTAE